MTTPSVFSASRPTAPVATVTTDLQAAEAPRSMLRASMSSGRSWLASYLGSFKEALASRRRIEAPTLPRIVLPVSAVLFGLILFCIAIAPEGDIDFQFREEEGIVTSLSAIFLAMASAFAGLCWLTEGKPGHGIRLWWLLTCIGFFFFACDELMRFHEHVGTFMRREMFGRPSHFFRNWNDAIVVGYGVVALPVIGYFLPRILRLPRYVELLALGFFAYAFHTLVDVLPHADDPIGRFMQSIPSSVPEESGKLFASTFFAVAMFVAQRTLTRQPSAMPASSAAENEGASGEHRRVA